MLDRFLQGLLVDKNLKVPKKIKKLWDKNKYKLFDIYTSNHANLTEIAFILVLTIIKKL